MISAETLEQLRLMCTRMRLAALEMALGAGRTGAHLGPALSCIEILAVLYGHVLRLDIDNPSWSDRDRFIASKAHCVLAHYAALAEAGFIPRELLVTFEKRGSILACHPAMNAKLGLEYSGGSLGMAFGFAIGLALDASQKGRKHRVFVLLGDGELDEGSNWEGFMCASHLHLNNLVAVIDRNQLQYDGLTEEIMSLDNLSAKTRAFGWETIEINGHDLSQLLEALEARPIARPLAVIANTIKGKGVSFMENVKEWHHSVLSQTQFDQAVKEIAGTV